MMKWFQLSKVDILKKLQVEEDIGLTEGERKIDYQKMVSTYYLEKRQKEN